MVHRTHILGVGRLERILEERLGPQAAQRWNPLVQMDVNGAAAPGESQEDGFVCPVYCAVSQARLMAKGMHPGVAGAGGAGAEPLSVSAQHHPACTDAALRPPLWGLHAGPQGARGLGWQFLAELEADLAQRDPGAEGQRRREASCLQRPDEK